MMSRKALESIPCPMETVKKDNSRTTPLMAMVSLFSMIIQGSTSSRMEASKKETS